MRLPTRMTLSGLVLLALVACGAPAPQPQDEEQAEALGRDTDETVFDDTIQTQDRARAVEGVSLGRKADTDAAIEQSEGAAARDEP